MANKSPEAFRTISEVSQILDIPPHVLRFWESRFTQIKPVKRGGGRRYYRPDDICLLRGIRGLLYDDGMTIKGAQKILRERGVRHVIELGAPPGGEEAAPPAPRRKPARAASRKAAPKKKAPAPAPDAVAKPVQEPAGKSASETGDLFGEVETLVKPDADSAAEVDEAAGPAAEKRAALRELVRQLEALRAEMVQAPEAPGA